MVAWLLVTRDFLQLPQDCRGGCWACHYRDFPLLAWHGRVLFMCNVECRDCSLILLSCEFWLLSPMGCMGASDLTWWGNFWFTHCMWWHGGCSRDVWVLQTWWGNFRFTACGGVACVLAPSSSPPRAYAHNRCCVLMMQFNWPDSD